ncbi:MAG: transporter substrate-binding domain-containing protein [Candidatus Cloacimonetes bacterium]|nr:transporter substrate-binding domain-containing protein [Candidatus Cloacimonadota bacterium]
MRKSNKEKQSVGMRHTLLVFFFLIFITSANANKSLPEFLTQEEKIWLEENKDKLTLYFNTEFPPIEFISEKGDFVGLGADIIEKIEDLLNISFIKTPCYDWNEHLAALENGECAIAPTIVSTSERQKYAYFTQPYATVPVVLITQRNKFDKLLLEDLKGYKIGVVSGFATEGYLADKSLLTDFSIISVENVLEGLENVSFGQTDAFAENLAVAAYYIEQSGIPNLRVAGKTDYFFSWSIGISRKYPLLYSSIQKALSEIPVSEQKKMKHKWINLDVEQGLDPITVLIIKISGVFSLLLIVSLIVITIYLKKRLRQRIIDLHRSEEFHRKLLQTIPDLIVKTDIQGRIVFLNEYGLKKYPKLNQDDFLGKNVNDFIIEEDREKAMINTQKMFETQLGPIEYRLRIESSIITTEVNGDVLYDDKNNPYGIVYSIRDVTERKKTEKDLAESRRILSDVINTIPSGVFWKDRNGFYMGCNKLVAKEAGVSSPEELVGLTDIDLSWKDQAEQYRVNDLKVIEGGVPQLNFEETKTTSDGRKIILRSSKIPLCADDGNVYGVLGVWDDITEQKNNEAEREKLMIQLSRSQRIESVGRLAGGIAHDFNNMLGVILGNIELAISRIDSEDPLMIDLKEIRVAAERSADLTKQLLAFARKQTISPGLMDLNETITGMLRMLQRLIGEDIVLQWKPGTDLWSINADVSQIDQILANLCVNSRDAITSIGKIIIETENIYIDEIFCRKHKGVQPGEYVKLSVSDDGHGMNKEILTHLFEPFFTTKEVGKGTGLGLSTVYGIAKQNKAFIDVYSELNIGTVFSIYFPRYISNNETVKTVRKVNTVLKGNETILLVEDEPAILKMTESMLIKLGYNTIAAQTPAQAEYLARKHSGKIDLLITDVVMPEMNGKELAQNIIIHFPKIKRLFMSGYPADIIADHGVVGAGISFIKKPFNLQKLSEKIREVIENNE